MDNLKDIMYAGLGLAKQTETQIKETYDVLVAKGKRVDEEGKNLVNNYFNLVEDLKKNVDEKLTDGLNTNIDKVEEFLQTLKK